jgi:hypothetical protein
MATTDAAPWSREDQVEDRIRHAVVFAQALTRALEDLLELLERQRHEESS